jgi:hypothetical protein
MDFGSFCPQLSEFGEILYKVSAHNADEHVNFLQIRAGKALLLLWA